jgi:hypothetical protein
MEQIEYKKYRIDHVYDCSEGYNELDHYTVWTPNGLDMVSEEFATIEQAKLFIDNQWFLPYSHQLNKTKGII